jgi:hypothetical protein
MNEALSHLPKDVISSIEQFFTPAAKHGVIFTTIIDENIIQVYILNDDTILLILIDRVIAVSPVDGVIKW